MTQALSLLIIHMCHITFITSLMLEECAIVPQQIAQARHYSVITVLSAITCFLIHQNLDLHAGT